MPPSKNDSTGLRTSGIRRLSGMNVQTSAQAVASRTGSSSVVHLVAECEAESE